MTKKKVVKKKTKQQSIERQLQLMRKDLQDYRHFHAQTINKLAWINSLIDNANRLGDNLQSLSIIERLVKAIDQLTIAADTVIRGPVKPNPIAHPPKRHRR